jgi:hypothetical protein
MNSGEDKELKQLWKKYSEAASRSRLNQKEITAMVEQAIVLPFKRMRIGIFSGVFCGLLGCIWFTYFGLQHWRDWPVFLPSALVAGGCIYAISRQILAFRRLQQVRSQNPEIILETLRKSISKMDRQNRFNALGTFLLVLFCGCFVLLNNIFIGHLPYFSALRGFSSAARWSVSIGILAAIAVGYACAQWHRKRFYKEPMERIRQAISEIEQEN